MSNTTQHELNSHTIVLKEDVKDEAADAKEHKSIAETIDPEYENLLQTDPSKGLTDAEVEERMARFGKNGKLHS